MSRISIIIPFYNKIEYLKNCLKAIALQTYKDFEVIVIDDCSTECSSIDIRTAFIENGLFNYQILRNEINLGPSLTRKKGIESSRSEFITFCDSDDEYEPSFLKKMLFSAEQNSADVVFCSYKSVYSNGKYVYRDCVSKIQYSEKKQLIATSVDSLCCLMVKRTIFDDIVFPNIRNGEDMAIIPLIISKASAFGYVNEFLYNYNYRANTLSKKPDINKRENLWLSFKYIFDCLATSFPEEVEFLGIRNYLYGATLNLLKVTFDIEMIQNTVRKFEELYPNWTQSSYIKLLPKYKRIYLLFLRKRFFFGCFLFARLHMFISR